MTSRIEAEEADPHGRITSVAGVQLRRLQPTTEHRRENAMRLQEPRALLTIQQPNGDGAYPILLTGAAENLQL